MLSAIRSEMFRNAKFGFMAGHSGYGSWFRVRVDIVERDSSVCVLVPSAIERIEAGKGRLSR
jgi:hypothetical protein